MAFKGSFPLKFFDDSESSWSHEASPQFALLWSIKTKGLQLPLMHLAFFLIFIALLWKLSDSFMSSCVVVPTTVRSTWDEGVGILQLTLCIGELTVISEYCNLACKQKSYSNFQSSIALWEASLFDYMEDLQWKAPLKWTPQSIQSWWTPSQSSSVQYSWAQNFPDSFMMIFFLKNNKRQQNNSAWMHFKPSLWSTWKRSEIDSEMILKLFPKQGKMYISMELFLETVKLLVETFPHAFMGQMYNVFLKNKNHKCVCLNGSFNNSLQNDNSHLGSLRYIFLLNFYLRYL